MTKQEVLSLNFKLLKFLEKVWLQDISLNHKLNLCKFLFSVCSELFVFYLMIWMTQSISWKSILSKSDTRYWYPFKSTLCKPNYARFMFGFKTKDQWSASQYHAAEKYEYRKTCWLWSCIISAQRFWLVLGLLLKLSPVFSYMNWVKRILTKLHENMAVLCLCGILGDAYINLDQITLCLSQTLCLKFMSVLFNTRLYKFGHWFCLKAIRNSSNSNNVILRKASKQNSLVNLNTSQTQIAVKLHGFIFYLFFPSG